MKSHPVDTMAQAIILFDIGKIDVNNYWTSFERHVRIKLFRKECFNDWGTQKFIARKGSISKIRATTHNLENGVIQSHELPKRAIYKSSMSRTMEEISLAFANLQEGSVIEFSYTEKMNGLYLPRWRFQYAVPNLWSEYTVHTPLSSFEYHVTGSLALTEHSSEQKGRSQRWLIRDVPAFKPEPLMPDMSVYRSTILFYGKDASWLKVHGYYCWSPSAGGIIKSHEYLAEKARALTAEINNPKDKVRAISDYIKEQVSWNGIRDIYAREPSHVLEKKEGTAADINLLLGSMLQKIGFDVNLVLLSTRDNGFILQDYPTLDQFNYVVCHINIDSTNLFLDATEKLLPYDLLPERCFNHKGFFVAPDKFGWIGIEPIRADKVTIQADLNLTDEGEIRGTVKRNLDDYAAYLSRKTYEKEGEDGIKEPLEKVDHWNIGNIRISNINELDKPVFIDYDVEAIETGIITGNKIYLSPFFSSKEKSNPFIDDTRSYPVDFEGLTEMVTITSITLPDNYEIESLPSSNILALPENGARCVFHFSESGRQVFVTTRLQINKTLFMPREYRELKEFYARIIAKQGESIVLQKRDQSASMTGEN